MGKNGSNGANIGFETQLWEMGDKMRSVRGLAAGQRLALFFQPTIV